MNKIKQRIYEFGKIVNGMTITKDTHIENLKNIPITFENKIIGQCAINTDDDGIICDGIIYDDDIINKEDKTMNNNSNNSDALNQSIKKIKD